MNKRTALLTLEDGHVFEGFSFGWESATAGEVVFNTGMVGYPESLTDPSYYGQILALTYPLIGNYGVPEFLPDSPAFESDRIQIRGLVVSDYSTESNHWNSRQSLSDWLKTFKIPAITGIDTRTLTKILREKGTMLGKITLDEDIPYYDPNRQNIVAEVSCSEPRTYGKGKKRIALLDCGCKRNIITQLSARANCEVLRLPWDADVRQHDFNGLFISNGPGDPQMCTASIDSARYALENNIPILGICLGNQILALAAGANTYKLKYGHRGQNQPVIDQTVGRCYITSQNHGFAVDDKSLPEDWQTWFSNLNDQTNEGLIHRSGRFMSVQFHPEAAPGPLDTTFIFNRFLDVL
ncbi:MAG: glutamine-hydrolyzing carbamoyl-phosphate synthase small subunit [Candidatus Neomarinimicrobiota bacterium]